MSRSTQLKIQSRSQFRSLLDARSLVSGDDEAIAIIFVETGREPIVISRRKFQEQVGRMGKAIRTLGVKPRDIVIIAHNQNLESIYLFWGALAVGAVPSIIHTVSEKIPAELYFSDIPDLIRHSKARAVFTSDEFAMAMADQVDCDVFGSKQLDGSGEAPSGYREVDPDEIAFLQHSSGSTGAKKGAALSHIAVLNQLASYSEILEIDPEDVIVSWMPLYHDGGLIAGHILPLVQGIPLVLMSPFDWVKHPALMFRSIHEYRGTLCWLPNFAYNHSARRVRDRDLEGISLSSMRAFINAAEPVRDDSHRMFIERFGDFGLKSENLTVMYGMAENVLAITQTAMGKSPRLDIVDQLALEQMGIAKPLSKEDGGSRVLVSCGPPLKNVEVEVVDEEFRRLPERHVGEIIVRSDCLLAGYYLRPDLDEEVFRDGWHLTGDLGYLFEGEMYVTGRKKDLIIHAGKNIYPHDLEEIASEVNGVHPGRTVAFGIFDDQEGTELIVLIAEVDSGEMQEHSEIASAIKAAVAQRTSVTASYVEIVDDRWIIKTSSGKIARAANRAKWLELRRRRDSGE